MTSIYQKEIADARKKCMEAKKKLWQGFGWKSRQRWVETKNRGLKTGGISVSLTY